MLDSLVTKLLYYYCKDVGDAHLAAAGERLSFDVEVGPQGRKQAQHIQRLKMRMEPAHSKKNRRSAPPRRFSGLKLAACASVLCAIGAVATQLLAPPQGQRNDQVVAVAVDKAEANASKSAGARNEAGHASARSKRNAHRPPDQLISQNEVGPAIETHNLSDPNAVNPGADALLKSATPSGKL